VLSLRFASPPTSPRLHDVCQRRFQTSHPTSNGRLHCNYPSPLHYLCACFPRPGPCLSKTVASNQGPRPHSCPPHTIRILCQRCQRCQRPQRPQPVRNPVATTRGPRRTCAQWHRPPAKTKAVAPNTAAPSPLQPAVALIHTRHPHHHVGQLAASPLAALDCSTNRSLALAARPKVKKLQCRSDDAKLAAPWRCQHTRRVFVLAALQAHFEASHLSVCALVPARCWRCRIAARWQIAAQDCQHRLLSSTP
jgi:hypothetical protein